MEPLSTQPSMRDRMTPWIEGGALAMIVMVVVTLGGEAVRTSYHGYLHTTIGESVLRDGLLPENPYHAGSDLRYYLLYPTLGVLLGRFGGGPLWGFAILNIFAAALMGPALDALGKRFGLDYRARRFAFAAMVVGFNGLGWILLRMSDAPELPEGAMPLAALMDSTRLDSFRWDGRLQSFLPKFFNVSSFALALPFALFTMSENLRDGTKALWRCGALLGITTAINPLVGLFVGLLVVIQKLIAMFKGEVSFIKLLPVGTLSLFLALPFLLPVLFAQTERDPNAVSPQLPFEGVAWANLIGPLFMLLLLGVPGLWAMKTRRWHLLLAIGIAAVFSFASLPWGNEYKFPRMAGILLAIPMGSFLSQWSKRWPGAVAAVAMLLVCVPMSWQTVKIYSAWGDGGSYLLDHVEEGRLKVRDAARLDSWPASVEAAEGNLPADAVLMIHPRHPNIGGGQTGAQGNQLAPTLTHALLVDSPQIHNSDLLDRQERLDACLGFWEGRRWAMKALAPTPAYDPDEALLAARSFLPERPLAVISRPKVVETGRRLQESGATMLAQENGVELWLFPALQATAEN